MANSADNSPDGSGSPASAEEDASGAAGMSDPDLDDLGLAIPEFRVPTGAHPAAKVPEPGPTEDLEEESDVEYELEEDFADEPTHRVDVDELLEEDSDDSDVIIEEEDDGDDDEDDGSTHSVDVDELLQEDQEAAFADEEPADQEPFDRAELVKTVRMDAFDRDEVERGAAPSFDIVGGLQDQRFAPDVLVFPPRVLTKKWQDGASTKPNGGASSPGVFSQDRAAVAATIRTSPLPDVGHAASEMELDSDEIVEESPPPQPDTPPPAATRRPGRARRNTGPLQHTEPQQSPQAQTGGDDDISGIVQELLDEKKEDPKKPPKKKSPRRDDKRVNWFREVFTEEYFRTLSPGLQQQTTREARFIHQVLGLQKKARVLDLGCGFGRHAIELAAREYEIAALDVSMPMLQHGLAEAQRRGLTIKFVQRDMRELNFNEVFDACYCWQTTFGYFDDRTNVQVAQGVARALKPGGRFLLEVVNRDYVVGEMPSRTWWEGHECVFLEEVEFDNHYSVLHTKRSFIYEDGSPPREFSSFIRLYCLHELRQLLHFAGFRILEVSGGIHHRGSFLGPTSPSLIILAERTVKE